MSKRVLIITDGKPEPTEGEVSGHYAVHYCSDLSEALSVLMGGSAGFGKQYYSQTGKIRPEIVLIDESYFDKEEGKEFIRLIRKYYSLQNIPVFLTGSTDRQPEEAVLRKYNMAGFLPKPYNLQSLFSDPGSDISNSTSTGDPLLSMIFLAWPEAFGKPAATLLKLKNAALGSIKLLLPSKAIVAVSGTVLACALAAVPELLPAEGESVEMPVSTEITTGTETIVAEPTQPVCLELPAETPTKAVKTAKKPEPKILPTVVHTVPAIPQREYKIKVVEE